MRLLALLILYYGSFRSSVAVESRVDPLVISPRGLIRGLRANDGDYAMFLGIPFAEVDSENPFGQSTPYPIFDSTFNAYDDSIICPQVEEFNNTIAGSLDCLNLNVYVPNIASSHEHLPVLVWIYGGGFTVGFAGREVYGPKHIVRHDIILVTINYRLGPYGFMCLNTESIPGNQGLKDQLLGLKWVKENIASFGGDPNKITIMGESAGGASVDLHLISPHEKLYNKVIMQSGTSLSPWVIREPNLEAAVKLAEQLGFGTDDAEEALSFLATIDPHLVIGASASLKLEFGPCVEQKFDDVENFINDYPINAKKSNKITNTPILIGYNSDEMLPWYSGKNEEFFSNLEHIFQDNLNAIFDFNEEELTQASKIIRNFYIGDEVLTSEVKQDITDFDSDISFVQPTIASAIKYLEQGSGNIFLYMFSHNGEINFLKKRFNITEGGASHADEIGYLFEQRYNINKEITPEDQLIIDRISTLWTNFVKHSDPTPEVTNLLPVKWLPVSEQSMYYLNIGIELALEKRPFKQRTAFWQLFHSKYEQFQKGIEQ